MLLFHAVPAWQLDAKKGSEGEEVLRPAIAEELVGYVDQALARIEYRGFKAADRARALIAAAGGRPAIYARPPNDLPALLRTADQLLTMMRQESGERAHLWRCECGTRYAVPVNLLRPVSIRCDRCGRTIELDPIRSTGEPVIADPKVEQISACRQALSDFFREAMARNWIVLVSSRPEAR